ncbi:organoarsenical effux MFS transporter ArsJ [Pseudooceanicola sp. CBS1P-1]|uniref:Organoarsenical effux MFS transporter ArsJ n=1 Tax=Pseudooceanicola albus TaxID=2692189 RepID=A0A6L7G5X5_9RHOB|nr:MULTISPECIES: organoarsenical effux MFS transporter ArsJ [Pseudooceanicola]MBT9384157.1 organoarsenical effux MFS transporter ArsJ [Pseudooceanicola endophyticus]MXN19744.1 organoarsenical effux MFS transporter ArsJ [Pseudooceanicola albus]
MTDTPPARGALQAYVAVTAAYWAFMLTDGALRMLVLLHFHTLGFSPVQLAYLFLLYEVAGILTNLCAGWIAARFGLTKTLYAGLALQVLALLALTRLDPGWALGTSVAYVMAVQGASGVAKDLAKMSSKSAVKLLAPQGNGSLFRWVALLTGSKNAVKGAGFLLGAGLLALAGFTASLLAMAGVLAVILAAVAWRMPEGLPKGRKGVKFTDVFSRNPDINWLSFARVFLFGARDVWFVVGIPIYFYAVLSDGSAAGDRTAFFAIGSFMAVWTILYGAMQALAPKFLGAATRPQGQIIAATRHWVTALIAIPLILALLVALAPTPAPWLTATLALGLLGFGALFAVNSALHSYLILAFTSGARVTMDVGFYYMANAAGRLLGTLLSGLSYQLGGLPACLGTAALLLGLSRVGAGRLGK